MTRRRFASIAIPTGILLVALARAGAQDDALDPVKVASNTHKIALENPFVRILDVVFLRDRSSRATAIRTV